VARRKSVPLRERASWVFLVLGAALSVSPSASPAAGSVAAQTEDVTATGREPRTGALITVFALFALLAFSEDLVDITQFGFDFHLGDLTFGLVVLALDVIVLIWIAAAGRRSRRKGGRSTGKNSAVAFGASWAWWAFGSIWVLALDSFRLLLLQGGIPLLPDLGLLLAYLPGLSALLAFTLDINPIQALRARNVAAASERLDDLMAAVSLVIGTGAAYIGMRVYGTEIGTIDKEYFAQVSQVIPLLIVALGFERRWFEIRAGSHPVRWGVGAYTVLILVIGEALAISALPNDPDEEGGLYEWHEYTAFAVTLYACFVALSTLVIVLLRYTSSATSSSPATSPQPASDAASAAGPGQRPA